MNPDRRWRTARGLVRALRYEWSVRRAWRGRLAAVRGLWHGIVRCYPYEICACGARVSHAVGSHWRASDDLWSEVAGWDGWERDMGEYAYLGPPGTECPRCFTHRAEAKGIAIHWEATRGA